MDNIVDRFYNRMTRRAVKCPSCGDPNAYVGFNTVECPNPGCMHYRVPNNFSSNHPLGLFKNPKDVPGHQKVLWEFRLYTDEDYDGRFLLGYSPYSRLDEVTNKIRGVMSPWWVKWGTSNSEYKNWASLISVPFSDTDEEFADIEAVLDQRDFSTPDEAREMMKAFRAQFGNYISEEADITF